MMMTLAGYIKYHVEKDVRAQWVKRPETPKPKAASRGRSPARKGSDRT